MINIDYRSGVAIYEQIIKGIERLIHCGGLEKDQKLPSVREFSAELAVNPNTIQKAYSALEQKGMIYSVKGRGNFVSGDTQNVLNMRYDEILEVLKNNVEEILDLGYNKELLKQKLLQFSENGGGTDD
ncbi:MAG: GntR family transcriptional regulator [Oscillospiraceae bacterium]